MLRFDQRPIFVYVSLKAQDGDFLNRLLLARSGIAVKRSTYSLQELRPATSSFRHRACQSGKTMSPAFCKHICHHRLVHWKQYLSARTGGSVHRSRKPARQQGLLCSTVLIADFTSAYCTRGRRISIWDRSTSIHLVGLFSPARRDLSYRTALQKR
jgi:hypothetical protein